MNPNCSTGRTGAASGSGPYSVEPRLADTRIVDLIWRRLTLFCLVYGIGWALVWAYYGVVVPAGAYGYPQNTFLFNPVLRHTDLTATWVQSLFPNPYVPPPPSQWQSSRLLGRLPSSLVECGVSTLSAYFPFPYWVLRKLQELTPTSVVLLYVELTLCGVLSVWWWWLRKQRASFQGDSRWLAIVILTLLIAIFNYPLIFALDRGNLDPLAMCLMYAAVELARTDKGVIGGVLLGLASSAKGFPLAALVIWIRRRLFWGLVASAVCLVGLILLPAMDFEGGLTSSLKGLAWNLKWFRQFYVVGIGSARFSADFLNAIRLLGTWTGHELNMVPVAFWYERVTLVWACILGLLGLVVRDCWRELLAPILVMLVFPNVTNDYKLVLLLPVVFEWLTSTATGWRNWVFGVAAVLLLLPKHFYHPIASDDASLSCIINPLLILALTLVLWPTAEEMNHLRNRLPTARMRHLGRVIDKGTAELKES